MKNKTNSDNSSSGNEATTSNSDNLNDTKRDNMVTEETNVDNNQSNSCKNITNSDNSNIKLDNNSDNTNIKLDNNGKECAKGVPSTSITDNNMNIDLRECSTAMITIVPSQTQQPLILGTIIVKPDATYTGIEEIVQTAVQKPTMSADADTPEDPLQGKSTPEKITIETLLNMGNSLETDDPLLDENAQLMPVDRPPEIPIKPKGDIPTEPVNPEAPPRVTPPPDKDTDTDKTEVLEPTKEETGPDKITETGTKNKVPMNSSKTDDSQTKSKKKKKKQKKTETKKPKPPNDTKDGMKGSDNGNKKGKLVTETFILCKRGKPKRKFYCVVRRCKKICDSIRELNNHHLTVHPKMLCDICNKIFDMPSSMNRHRYSHKIPKHFYADCGKGFFFESELTPHRCCHLKIPGYLCFAKKL